MLLTDADRAFPQAPVVRSSSGLEKQLPDNFEPSWPQCFLRSPIAVM